MNNNILVDYLREDLTQSFISSLIAHSKNNDGSMVIWTRHDLFADLQLSCDLDGRPCLSIIQRPYTDKNGQEVAQRTLFRYSGNLNPFELQKELTNIMRKFTGSDKPEIKLMGLIKALSPQDAVENAVPVLRHRHPSL